MAKGKLDRIQLAILAASVVCAASLGIWQGPRWALGGFSGGLVGFLNFRWLRRTVERLLDDSDSSSAKGRAAFFYAFKLAIVAAILVALIRGAGIPALAVLIGLGAMPVGIIAEMFWGLAGMPAEPDGKE